VRHVEDVPHARLFMGRNETDDSVGTGPRRQEREGGCMAWRKAVLCAWRGCAGKRGGPPAHAAHDCARVAHARRIVFAAHFDTPAARNLDENLPLAIPVEVEAVVHAVIRRNQPQADCLRPRLERQPSRQPLAPLRRSATAAAARGYERERRQGDCGSTAYRRLGWRVSQRSALARQDGVKRISSGRVRSMPDFHREVRPRTAAVR